MTAPAGRRDTYLTMWREDGSTPDASGFVTPSYTKVCNVWGEVSMAAAPASATRIRGSDEQWTGSHVNANLSHLIRIPWVDNAIDATGKFTEYDRGTTTTYQVAGPPMSDGGDLIYPVAEEV